MEPIAATVAGAEPEIAPKNAQVTTATIAKPPVKWPTKESAEQPLPGRFMRKIVGKSSDGYRPDSQILNIGYCLYCAEGGSLEILFIYGRKVALE